MAGAGFCSCCVREMTFVIETRGMIKARGIGHIGAFLKSFLIFAKCRCISQKNSYKQQLGLDYLQKSVLFSEFLVHLCHVIVMSLDADVIFVFHLW